MIKFFLFLLFSTSALAQFNGSFSGSGEAFFASGRRYQCTEIFLRLETTLEVFRLREGGYKCGGFLNAEFDPFRLSIRGGGLFHLEQQLGHISENQLDYQIFDPQDGSTYYLTLNREGDAISYFERWHDGEKIALTIRGILKRKP